jgi:hypothetical protein
MDDWQFERFIGLLKRMVESLEILARGNQPEEPNLIKPIEAFTSFDWPSIGATVVREDGSGPTHLEYGGYLWTRRSPANKFSPAIWFSRSAGRDEEGNTQYLRLITFREISEAEPLPARVGKTLDRQAPRTAAAARQQEDDQDPDSPPGAPGGESKGNPDQNHSSNDKISVFISSNKYYTDALGARFTLPKAWPVEIARLAGVDHSKKPVDFAPAYSLLLYFNECNTRGMDLESAWSVLRAHKMVCEDAIVRIREK